MSESPARMKLSTLIGDQTQLAEAAADLNQLDAKLVQLLLPLPSEEPTLKISKSLNCSSANREQTSREIETLDNKSPGNKSEGSRLEKLSQRVNKIRNREID